MSSTISEADVAGDILIDCAAPELSISEAAYLARIPIKSIRNWIVRTGLTFSKDSATGHWRFSLHDVLRLVVIHDLALRPPLSVALADAVKIADIVLDAAIKSTARGKPAGRPNISVLVGADEQGRLFTVSHDIREPGHYYPPARGDSDGYIPLRRPHIVIPATSLLIDTMLRTKAMRVEQEADDD